MKTLFITSFHPHISRNILSTSVLDMLKAQNDLRLVIIVPDYKVEYFQDCFAGLNVLIEGVGVFKAARTFRGLLFKRLGMYVCPTDTVRLRRQFKFFSDRKLGTFVFAGIMGILGKRSVFRRMVRALDLRFSPKGFFDELLDRYRPDAIFSTDPQNDNDVSLMHDARMRRIPIIGMVRSWDNTTQRAFRVFPDRMLVGSRALADECVAIHGFSPDRVVITGQPHYDRYGAPTRSREQFFHDFGLDPAKPLILYAPVGDVTLIMKENDMDQYVMEILGSLGIQVLVRFPPDENVRLINFQKPDTMVIHRPGHAFKNTQFTDREIAREDDDSLIDQIFYSDLVVTGPTSVSLDAAFMDKPVIVVDLYPTPRHFFEKVYQYSYSHIKKMLACGGVYHARTKEDLIKKITAYMKNPGGDTKGRQCMRDLWFSHADGHAGERVAKQVIAFIKDTR